MVSPGSGWAWRHAHPATTILLVSPKTFSITDQLHAYVVAHGSEPDEVGRDLIEQTRMMFPDDAGMMISPEQARFFTLLTKIMGVRRAVEVGTFTGYSALAIARGLAEDGQLICLDTSEEFTRLARRCWTLAGVGDRIELRLGPAEQGLRELPAAPELDLAFIDAEKTGYCTYWEELVPRMRPGGVILVDNVLLRGRVLDPGYAVHLRAVVEFNTMARADDRVEVVMLPIGDGLLLARRRVAAAQPLDVVTGLRDNGNRSVPTTSSSGSAQASCSSRPRSVACGSVATSTWTSRCGHTFQSSAQAARETVSCRHLLTQSAGRMLVDDPDQVAVPFSVSYEPAVRLALTAELHPDDIPAGSRRTPAPPSHGWCCPRW
jgi:caffeoyl-CoA O-methyltransferase